MRYSSGSTPVKKLIIPAQDEDILTAIGLRPEAASHDDNREKFTPAQNLNCTHRRENWPCSSSFKNPRIFSFFTY